MTTMAVALDISFFEYDTSTGILQVGLVSQFDEGLWQQWPLPSTEISFWHSTALMLCLLCLCLSFIMFYYVYYVLLCLLCFIVYYYFLCLLCLCLCFFYIMFIGSHTYNIITSVNTVLGVSKQCNLPNTVTL